MQSIRRLYVAKKGIFADEAKRLLTDLQENLLIKGLTDIHIFHRYDVSVSTMRLLKRLKI